MPPRTTQNPSALIRDVPVLDGTSVSFPAWRTRLEDLFAIQGFTTSFPTSLLRGGVRNQLGCPLRCGSGHLEDDNPCRPGHSIQRSQASQSPLQDHMRRLREEHSRKAYDASRLFWCARHDPSQPIARWIAKVRNTASDLKSVKLTPADQQICDRLLRGLDDTWKPIRDHLVYSPNEISLDDAIGALEAHKVSTQISLDHTADSYANAADAKPKKKLGCWRCGQTGHHSATCSNPPLRQSKAAANAVKARAGATSVAPLGNGVQYLATTLNRYEKLNIGEK
ncbi:hypothetical protein H4Q26_008065 [Puccinia striiformis f. sp. tritici PST-130]|nr:hypothetical protein H4Q26_008065 [Puccinia striiformis f. sp. tritici PST-130]